MASFATTIKSFIAKINGDVIDASHINDLQDEMVAVQTKLGVDNSAVTTSLDYKLKNASSVNPGHKHTITDAMTDVVISSPSNGQGLVYESASGKWKNATTSIADAAVGTKGINLMSVAPVSAASPIAVGDNDPRIPSYNTDTGSANAYVVTRNPALTAYTSGVMVTFKATNANTTTSTVNVNGLGAVTIKKLGNTNLASGDISAGMIVELEYDGTNFQMLNPVGNAPLTPTGDGSGLTGVGIYKNGTFTKDASDASTTQTIAHGLGKIPKRVRFDFIKTLTAVTSTKQFGFAIYNGTTSSGISIRDNSSVSGYTSGFDVLRLNDSISDVDRTDGVITFDATNITITWTKTNSPTGIYQFVWEAIG